MSEKSSEHYSFQQFFERSSFILCVLDDHWNIVSANNSFKKYFKNIKWEQSAQTPFKNLVHESCHSLMETQLDFLSKTKSESEFEIQCKDGIYWFSCQIKYDDHLQLYLLQLNDIGQLRREINLGIQAASVAKIGSWEMNMEDGQMYWTKITHDIFGTDYANYIPTKEKAMQFYLPHSRNTIEMACLNLIEKGEEFDLELELVNNQNKTIWVRNIGKAKYTNGVRSKIFGTLQDITHLKKIETDLVQSDRGLLQTKNLLRLALATMKIGVWELDINNNTQHWDESMYQLFPRDLEQRENSLEHFEMNLYPPDRMKVMNDIQQAIKDKKELHTEFRIYNDDGTLRWIKGRGQIELDDTGKAIRLIGCNWDVSEEKKIQQRINTLNYLIESSQDIFSYLNVQGRPLYFNSAASTFLKWDQKVVSFEQLISNDFYKKLGEAFNAARAGGNWAGEIWLKNFNDNSFIPYWVRTFGLKNEKGEIQFIAIIASDLREQKRHEEEMSSSARLVTLGEMSASIAHEIKNPLAAISGTLQLLKKAMKEGPVPVEKVQTSVERIEKTSSRIEKIVNGLRSVSRNADADPFLPTNIKSIFEYTIEICRDKIRSNNVDLRINLSNGPEVECREAQLGQVLINMVGNACDAIANLTDKWIELKTVFLEDKVQIRVIDSGPGISPEIFKKIMQPFFTTKGVGKGTGLGLSISKKILEEHGGTISIDHSCPNTCFVLEFPIKHVEQKNQDPENLVA